MPRNEKSLNPRVNSNTDNQTSSEMEQETENDIHSDFSNQNNNNNPENNAEVEINVNNIENEIIIDDSNNTYYPDKYKKCFIPQNDYAKKITLNTLKIMLIKIKEKSINQKIKGSDEVYIINKSWFEIWKKYTRYPTLKRIMKLYNIYESRPIKFQPDPATSPGEINNKELMIRYNINNNDGRNILVSKNNDSLDTRKMLKKDFKIITKARFDLLNDLYKCDHILKGKRIGDKDKISYEVFSVHLNIAFIPTLESFKEINDENYEDFKKTHEVIYDLYFKQNSTKEEIESELKNIYKEKLEILKKMGIKFLLENNEDELSNHILSLKYYKPSHENQKSIKEILDFIYSKETIEKIKKDEKIKLNELKLKKVINQSFNYLTGLFKHSWTSIKDNIDEVKNEFLLVEYVPVDKEEKEETKSIFKIERPQRNLHHESAAYREYGIENGMDLEQVSSHHHYRKDYKLEDQPLDEKNNKGGIVGLNNLGNTCYMNTGLQCLSNCELLTKYILGKYYEKDINKNNPIGSQGEIIGKYALVINHLWYGNNDIISPIQFKQAFGKVYQAFNDYRQQDTQEFISYLLDSLHEDLNKVINKPYIQTKDLPDNLKDEEIFNIKKNLYLCRNQSFIADLIYGFYKSTVFCPNENCKNISKSFEPFSMITLSLVNEVELRKIEEFKEERNKNLGIKEVYITFIPFKINFKPLYFNIKIKKDIDVLTFKKKIEIVTGYSHNSFEIYKLKNNEYIPIKDDVNNLEDFLKGENRIYLFQIPPYVFGKANDFFDKIHEKLVENMDKLYLEEEKFEGNDLYKDYDDNNKEEKKEEEKKEEEKNDEILNGNEMNIDINRNNNVNNIDNINNNSPNEESNSKSETLKSTKNEDNDDVEMDDQTWKEKNIDKTEWIRAELYNYTYTLTPDENKQKNEERIARSRIIYLNKNWSNADIYECLMKILDGARNDMNEIKQMWFQDLQNITINLDQEIKNKENDNNNNFFIRFDELNTQPLMLQYLKYYNINDDIKTKEENHDNSVVIYDPNEHWIKKIFEEFLKNKDNKPEDLDILFKLTWKPVFASDYKEGIEPIVIEKSEKLEELLKGKIEQEYFEKNNLNKNEIINTNNNGNKKNKLNLEVLLTNFNQVEKLSKNNEWYCPKCKNHQLADKKMEIYSISEVVIIHLKRFRNNRKIENLVDFPIDNLDLTKFLPNQNEKYIYDLFAVANHVGGLHGGHYFAYCKNYKNGEWYEFNDSHVDKIDKDKIVTENAYVLFYSRKRENKINEEELFKKPFIKIDHTLYE